MHHSRPQTSHFSSSTARSCTFVNTRPTYAKPSTSWPRLPFPSQIHSPGALISTLLSIVVSSQLRSAPLPCFHGVSQILGIATGTLPFLIRLAPIRSIGPEDGGMGRARWGEVGVRCLKRGRDRCGPCICIISGGGRSLLGVGWNGCWMGIGARLGF